MEHLTMHLHRPRTTRSPLSFWGDEGIIPFEPFSCFFQGMEKAEIERDMSIFIYLDSKWRLLKGVEDGPSPFLYKTS
ncbi:hypothetical protein Hanom_Chr09g00784991 [Helianthus anomalus]